MNEIKTYNLDHATSRVELKLMPGRLVVNTQGKGALDRLRTIDIALSDLKHFAVVPAIQIQHLAAGKINRADTVMDFSYDSEFIFSYHDNGSLKKKRQFVNNEASEFQEFIKTLEKVRPDASLRNLAPADALKQMGVMSAATTVKIVIGLLVLIPITIVILVQIFS